MKHSKHWLWPVAAMMPGLVLAQEKPAESSGEAAVELEEVIVTAQKREQKLIDVPMSITAIGGRELEERGINSVTELSFAVPGLSLHEDGPGSNIIFMRGMANLDGSDALVSVYLDDAPLTIGAEQLDTRVLDLERVEVLKGPQGTLYGQGSTAGTIRFITKKPKLNVSEGRVSFSESFLAGGDSKESVTSIVNVPVVTDKFAVRLATTLEWGGGWQDQPEAGITDGNNQDLTNMRAKALWQVNDKLQANATIVFHRNESRLGLGYENPDRTIFVALDPSKELIPKKVNYKLYNLSLNYDLAGAQLISATTYTDSDQQSPYSYQGGPRTKFADVGLEGNDARYFTARQFTQELRLTSASESPLQWTAGAYYRNLDKFLESYSEGSYNGEVQPPYVYIDGDEWKSYAVFGDISYKLTDRLLVGAGVRYFEDDQRTFNGSAYESDSFDSVDPRFYATYKIAENTNLYGSVAKGFRTGGFNSGDLPNYQPEKAWSYELGVKGSITGALSYEAAVFYTDYSDMIRRGLVFVEGAEPPLRQLSSNIGKAEIKGFEGGLSVRATKALTLSGTVTYIHSEITKVDSTDAVNQAGDRVDYTPKWAFVTSAVYDFRLGELPSFARLDYTYRDKTTLISRSNYPPENLPIESDEIGLLNATIGTTWNTMSLELFGTNLTNENKWIDPNYEFLNANRTRPRAVGVKVGFEF